MSLLFRLLSQGGADSVTVSTLLVQAPLNRICPYTHAPRAAQKSGLFLREYLGGQSRLPPNYPALTCPIFSVQQ